MSHNNNHTHSAASLSTGLREHLDTIPRVPPAHVPPRHISSSPGLLERGPLSSGSTPTPASPPASALPATPISPPTPELDPSYALTREFSYHSYSPPPPPSGPGWMNYRRTRFAINEKPSRLSNSKLPWKREGGWAGWRDEWVRKDALVIPLIVQAFSAGILDATTYADFQTFASNQTGNTILLCVSVVGTVQVIIKLTAISLGAFLSAAFIFGHLGHYFGVRQRGWIIFTTTWQILTLILAAILVSPSGPPIFHIGAQHEWFILFLFAHMSGAQVAQARQSSNTELPTAPMTSSYVDLMSDKYLFVGFRHKKAGPRNRKLAYTTCMIVGGLLGACIHRWAGSWEVVVVTLLLKCVMLGMICCAKVDDCPRLD